MKAAVWGAGQAGFMLSNMLPDNQRLICFIDANPDKQNKTFCGVPVMPPEEIKKLGIEKLWIAVLNKEAAAEIKNEIKRLNFDGEVIDIDYFRKNQDLRLASLRLTAMQVKERGIEGEIAELGVYKGDTAKELNSLFPDKKLYLFDTFCGFDNRDLSSKSGFEENSKRQNFSDASPESVIKRLPHPEKAVICSGYFPESVKSVKMPEFAFVSLDPDLYAPALSGLEIFYPLLSAGGVIHIHDYLSFQYKGIKRAADEFCVKNGLYLTPIADFHGSAVLVKPQR